MSQTFINFLTQRINAGGFTTEDALASFLPLAREVLDAHAAGLVAPLEGVDALLVERGKIYFSEANRLPLRRANHLVEVVQGPDQRAVHVVSETRRTTDVDRGRSQEIDLAVGDADHPVDRPVFLTAYVSWEHLLDCHDPLSDIYSLGMILASLACGLDFFDRGDVESFAAHRRNLFAIAPDVHPVVARAIVRMTELDRRRRPQDLASVIHSLENYRDQTVEFELELASSPEFASSPASDKKTLILSKLRERLFEVSRRNKLLHFRTTMQSVNLTHASVPLSLDVKNVRPDQILVWNDGLQDQLASGKPLSLNKHLNFSEVLYLQSQLERLIADARRDQAEYGFAQLRLVACFLHWANVKQQPVGQYDSPLVLVPVRLSKKKGIRDRFALEADAADAEINPVIRYQFKQLFNIELPAAIDLTQSKLDEFYAELAQKISVSEPGIELEKIDRPRIAITYEKARRRLDQYRRRARLSGRGVRKYLDLDYSYDPANYHPLGIKLFSSKVRTSATHLRELIEEQPRPRSFMQEPADVPVVEKERQFYSLQEGGEANPYQWSFDLCNVTLANFQYRQMSLVRDYESLLEEAVESPSFERLFSLSPRPAEAAEAPARPLDHRYDVVPCDPTQASAITRADSGDSYIIQGPPGTGKSQTITNLIADFVARGRRVLFVCEKRAAIDVVYARLRQCGLADLCCLIHDSQTDKKAFVMDLKETYERFLDPAGKDDAADQRRELAEAIRNEAGPLERFHSAMQSTPPEAGVTIRQLIDRCVELRDKAPPLDAVEREALPSYAAWHDDEPALNRFAEALEDAGGGTIWADHPLRILSPRLASIERPLELIARCATESAKAMAEAKTLLVNSQLSRERWELWGDAILLTNYARRVEPIARAEQLGLLDAASDQAKWFRAAQQELAKTDRAIAAASAGNANWREKLSAVDTTLALEHARGLEQSKLPWLRPVWWRLRRVLRQSYDFSAHQLAPPWSLILQELDAEHEVRHRRQTELTKMADQLDVSVDQIETLRAAIENVEAWLPQQPDWVADLHADLTRNPVGSSSIVSLAEASHPLWRANQRLSDIADNVGTFTFTEVGNALETISSNLDAAAAVVGCLGELSSARQDTVAAVRCHPFGLRSIEAAVAQQTLVATYRQQREVDRFSGDVRRRHANRLVELYDRWLNSNASAAFAGVRRRFLEHLAVVEKPTSRLTAEEKKFKTRYNRGRRVLEHEFGKQMRYKPIRDLVTDECGQVTRDLKPIWLMSPLSISDTLPLTGDEFDVVIFDEASQITLEAAVPALFRAPQAIIVGDEMQLPPTDFFSSKQSADDEEIELEEDGELVQYDLAAGSFLSHAADSLSGVMLGWHYRSRSESLITFSNWAFYDGRLLTVPEERLGKIDHDKIVSQSNDDGARGADEALRRPISFHAIPYGVYENRCNRAEAEYIAAMVRALLLSERQTTLGIVAFSEAQQQEIEQALWRLAADDKAFRDRLETEFQREDDNQFVGLLVKNLENIQGDERDLIILSVCYGRSREGKMRMNFGPINKSGGEKRLNVAFSRAKKHMAIVSSIRSTDITNDYNDGAGCLKNYLRYAEAASIGDQGAADRVIYQLARWARHSQSTVEAVDVVADQIAALLQTEGYLVDRAVGQSQLRCDLAVYRPGDLQYRLGILLDNPSYYYDQTDVLEREMMRPRLLRAFGWRVATVLAKDWQADPERTRLQLLEALEGAGDRRV